MKTMGDSGNREAQDHLWAEALWGVGLIGVVFGFVLVLVTVFGR